MVSFPLLGMFTGDEPTVTQSISALNRKPNKTVMVVTYTRHNNNHVTKMITGTIGGNNVFNYTLSNEDDFLSESGVGTASAVITAYVKFAVSYVYSFFGSNADLFTSSVLNPLAPNSVHFFVVTSSTACRALAAVGTS